MGEEDKTEVDCVGGIPDSGIGMAIGYSAGHKVPYQRGISKYTPTWPRSFMPANQDMRNLVAKMKLIPNKDMLRGKRCLFCDDSIVRGTQLRENTKVLKELGAKEVHMRIACPPLIYACPFINFSAFSGLSAYGRTLPGTDAFYAACSERNGKRNKGVASGKNSDR